MKKKLLLLLIILAVCGTLLPAASLAEQPADPDLIPVQLPLLRNPLTLKGVTSHSMTTFDTSPYAALAGEPQLVLDLTFSPIMHEESSGLTVYVDDRPVYSVRLTPAHFNGSNNGRVIIPLRNLDPAILRHNVEFRASLGILNDPFLDRTNQNLWVTVEKTSHVQITYRKTASDPLTLTHFPERMFHPQKPVVTLVYPVQHTREDDTLMAQIISYMSHKMRLTPGMLQLKREDEYKEAPAAQDALFVGLYAHFQPSTRALFPLADAGQLQSHAAVLAAVRSPQHPKATYYLLAAKDLEGGIKAIRQLNQRAFQQSLAGERLYLTGQEPLSADPTHEEFPAKLPVAKLGFPDGIAVMNMDKNGKVSFRYTPPPGALLKADSRLSIHFSYNDTFDPKRSTVTLTVNNVPVATQYLQQGEGKGVTIEGQIPSSELDAEQLDVALLFSFYEENFSQFGDFVRENGWARIAPDSYLELYFEQRNDKSFDQLPYPLIKNYRWNDVHLVLADDARSEDYQQAAHTIMALAAWIRGDDDGLQMMRGSDVSETDLQQGNYLIQATPERSWILKAYPELFDPGDQGAPRLFAHIVPAPHNEESFLVGLTSADPPMLEKTYEFFDIRAWRQKLKEQRLLRAAAGVSTHRETTLSYSLAGQRLLEQGSAPALAEMKESDWTGELLDNPYLRLAMQILLLLTTIGLLVYIWAGSRKR